MSLWISRFCLWKHPAKLPRQASPTMGSSHKLPGTKTKRSTGLCPTNSRSDTSSIESIVWKTLSRIHVQFWNDEINVCENCFELFCFEGCSHGCQATISVAPAERKALTTSSPQIPENLRISIPRAAFAFAYPNPWDVQLLWHWLFKGW